MEPDVSAFLKRVSISILATLVWIFINITIGIFLGWLFYEHTPTAGNIIFYVWLLASAAALIYLYVRIWRNRQAGD